MLYLESFEHDGTQQCNAAILDVCVVSLTLKQRWRRSEKREFITTFPLGPGSVHSLVALQRGHLLWASALPFHRLFCPTTPFFFFSFAFFTRNAVGILDEMLVETASNVSILLEGFYKRALTCYGSHYYLMKFLSLSPSFIFCRSLLKFF